MTLPSNLLSATQAHIDQLVAEQASEGPHLDFKRELPSTWNDAAKHEFLADATAFANAGGGDLIYGLNEDGQAKAAEVIPQVLANADQEVRRLQDFLLNLAEPRLPGVQVRAIPVQTGPTNGHVNRPGF
jgi:predicted HTH transcriptional regulator